MTLWVKVCANTSLADASLAAEAGADAVGFVFAPSPRQVTIAQVEPITEGLPSSIEKIGVFVESRFEEIAAAIVACRLTGVQIHRTGGNELAARLREHFGTALRILRVLHYGSDLADNIAALSEDKNTDAILVDSRTATVVGGTGLRFDWDAATAQFRSDGSRLVAAGGLDPDNVAEAINKLRPWGVDVASGVEASPGRKDPKKVRAFVENARRAQSIDRPH